MPQRAISGIHEDVNALDQDRFMEALVASLVVRRLSGIRPNDPSVRRGFSKILETVEAAAEAARDHTGDPQRLRQLVRLRNELRPSSSGSYEGFESALRALQLTFTSCPNPFYTEIAFTVPSAYASATLSKTPAFERDLAERAATAFIAEVDG